MERGPSEIRAQAEIVCDVVSRPRFTCAHHCAQMLCACIIPRMKSEREQEEATSTWSGRSLPYESRHTFVASAPTNSPPSHFSPPPPTRTFSPFTPPPIPPLPPPPPTLPAVSLHRTST
ncbi:hypothetical protein HZH68_006481 [Vespula germanica]|uniref:Uncharacterized protein n=1 Tax=Vespula germanica TaxID=30212 RepID=A0A834KBL3_VESGE|nr:hypothetical protein HZH68_006481 [Vespula germanica]